MNVINQSGFTMTVTYEKKFQASQFLKSFNRCNTEEIMSIDNNYIYQV